MTAAEVLAELEEHLRALEVAVADGNGARERQAVRRLLAAWDELEGR